MTSHPLSLANCELPNNTIFLHFHNEQTKEAAATPPSIHPVAIGPRLLCPLYHGHKLRYLPFNCHWVTFVWICDNKIIRERSYRATRFADFPILLPLLISTSGTDLMCTSTYTYCQIIIQYSGLSSTVVIIIRQYKGPDTKKSSPFGMARNRRIFIFFVN